MTFMIFILMLDQNEEYREGENAKSMYKFMMYSKNAIVRRNDKYTILGNVNNPIQKI